MKKRLSLIFILLFILNASICFALGNTEGGGNASRLFFMPYSVVNNRNSIVELSQQYSTNSSSVQDSYSNTNNDLHQLFRLRNNLISEGQINSSSVTATITSDNDWMFVNENNPTQRIPFELEVICVEKRVNDRSYDSNITKTKVGATGTSTFTSDGTSYSLSMPYTTYEADLRSWFTQYIREYVFCIKLSGTEPGSVETGYYSTVINLSTNQYYEYEIITYDQSGQKQASYQKEANPTHLDQRIEIRGYVGLEPENNISSCVFIVSERSDTYSMKLDPEGASPLYNVANIILESSDWVIGKETDKPSSGNNINKFKVYLSPTSDYNVQGQYKFIKMNSENQARTDDNTIYYDLYMRPEGSDYLLGSENYSNYNNDNTPKNEENKIGTIKKVPNTSSYEICPLYKCTPIDVGGGYGGDYSWQVTWKLDQDIFLKISDDSLDKYHAAGLYYSFIYFTVVVD